MAGDAVFLDCVHLRPKLCYGTDDDDDDDTVNEVVVYYFLRLNKRKS